VSAAVARAREGHSAAQELARREQVLLLAVAALVLAACLPLTRIFLGLGFLWQVGGGALAALGLDWAVRRRGAGPGLALLATVLAWLVFVGLLYAPETLLARFVPTPSTLAAVRDVFVNGLELIALTPSPTYPEPALVLLAVSGVWAIAHAIGGLVLRLQAPIAAIVLALVLWTVPLAIAAPADGAWLWALPLLAAAAALLLAYTGADLGRFGRWVFADDPAGIRRERNPLTTGGSALAGCAIVAGSLLAGLLPGFGEQPWYELRGSAGTTLTTNPIVGIHSRLVSSDTGPVLRVTSPRPIYVRTTSLDVYDGADEVWTSQGVNGDPVSGPVPLEEPLAEAQRALVELEVLDLPGGLLVPLPYQTVEVSDTTPDRLRYDPGVSTFFVDADTTLQPGDVFSTVAAVPAPSVEQLAAFAEVPVDASDVALPDIPAEVGDFARQVVAARGATTQLEQAVALQDELRSWTYSLDVVPNHRRTAMAAFLERRTGYCEQFAGTMAVMLRELGIPSRVAVGFTPGVPDQPELVGTGQPVTYTVSQANAHAWVEVLFPGYGWIAFEPTPRSDGNVLVPSATNLAPAMTVQTQGAAPQLPDPSLQDGQQPEDLGGDLPNAADVPQGQAPAGGAADRGRPLALVALGAVALAVVAAAAVALCRRPAREPSPLERVLRARTGLQRLGAGLRAPALASETDAEYLGRLLGARLPRAQATDLERFALATDAAASLSRRTGEAQWASALPEGAGAQAETAAAALEGFLLAGLPGWRRALVRVRGVLAEVRGDLRRMPRPRLGAAPTAT